MFSFRALLFAAALVLLQGCSSFQGAPSWNPSAETAGDKLFDEYVKKFFKPSSGETAVSVRNEYITVRMAQIDRSFLDYKQGLYTQRVGSAVGIDFATMLLAGAGAAVSDVGTKTGASAAAALLTGTKTSIDKNVYFDRTLPAMLAQMDALRAEQRAQLYAGALLPADRYSFSQADADLTKYRDAGSVISAIAAVTKQAGVAQEAAEKVLRDRLPSEETIREKLEEQGFSVQKAAVTDTTERLKRCVLVDGTLDPSLDKEFKAWFAVAHPAWLRGLSKTERDKLPPSITPSSDFMSTLPYETLRLQAFADPTLGPMLKSCN
jgi:hypothetical protein